MAEKEEPYPTWRYRLTKNGEISSKIFMSNAIPPGYVDSPAKCKKKDAKPSQES